MKRAISPCTACRCWDRRIRRLEEERDIPDVVQSERDERAFHDAVERECKGRLPMDGPIREGLDPVADWGPDKAQDHPRDNHGESRNDRHGALAGKKAEIARKLDLIEPVEDRGCDQAHDDAAKDAGLDGGNTHDSRRFDPAHLRENAHRSQKHREAHRARKRCNTVVVGQADRDADRKEQRKIGKDRAAGLGHDLRDDLRQPRKIRAADAQQNARHGKHRDGQHHAFADFLEIRKGVGE